MKIFNPNFHPITAQINNCSQLDNKTKMIACKEIWKMMTDEDYRISNEGDKSLNRFMQTISLGTLFVYSANHLGHGFWFDISTALNRQQQMDTHINRLIKIFFNDNVFEVHEMGGSRALKQRALDYVIVKHNGLTYDEWNDIFKSNFKFTTALGDVIEFTQIIKNERMREEKNIIKINGVEIQ